MRGRYPGFAGGDRTDIGLPAAQQKLLEALHATGKPVVLVLTTGSALAVAWAQENLPAIVVAWYPGQQGGNAVADVLFGDVNPAGRLPVTFYSSVDQLPAVRRLRDEGPHLPLLRRRAAVPVRPRAVATRASPTRACSSRATQAGAGDTVEVSRRRAATRARAPATRWCSSTCATVAAKTRAPLRELRGFERVHLKPGETKRVALQPAAEARPRPLRRGAEGDRASLRASYVVEAGASSADLKLSGRLRVN